MTKLSEIEISNLFATSLLKQNSLGDLLWSMATNIGTLLDFEDCVIYLKDGDYLVQKAAYGLKNPLKRDIKNQIKIRIGDGVVGSVAKTGIAELIPDVSQDKRYIFDEFGGKSELSVPLLFENKVIGILDSESSCINGFSAEDFKMFKYLANLATPRIVSAITEQEKEKALKELTIAREVAEHANAAKSQFLSQMSHELRTPLNAILGFGQLLMLNKDEFSDHQEDNIKEILGAGHHLLNLINEILDLAKIEAGKLELQTEEFSLKDILKEVIPLVRTQCDARSIEIIDEVSGKNFNVSADYIRFKQVLLNLISNAVKYNKEEGSIRLTGEVISNQALRISIADKGRGMTVKEIADLFTPFNRLHASHKIEGVGIGLVISKHLIELMGGAIGVKSCLGEGCSFWIEIGQA